MSSRLTPAGQAIINAAGLRHPHPPTSPTGWFADIDHEVSHDYPWQPVLAFADGDHRQVASMDVWFASREECEAYIAGHVIGQGLLPD